MALTLGTEIDVHQGDTDYLDFAAVKGDGTVQDLTGHTIYATAKYSFYDLDAAAIWMKSTALASVVVTNAAGGIGYVKLSPADFTTLSVPVRIVVDVRSTDPSGNVSTFDVRVLRVLPVVRRSFV